MMRERRASVLWFLLSLIFAFAAAFTAHAAYRRYTAGVPVVVATRYVEPLSPVPPGAVTLQNRPVQGLPADALRSVGEAVGRYARYGLVPGQVVQRGALVAPDGAPGTALAAKLQELDKQAQAQAGPAYRAYALHLNDKSGYRIAQPGDRVDVVAVVKGPGGNGEGGVLVQGALVLAKLDKADQGAVPVVPGQQQSPSAVAEGELVLALTPDDIGRVALAEELGRVSVALVPPGGKPVAGLVPQGQVFGPPGGGQAQGGQAAVGATGAAKP